MKTTRNVEAIFNHHSSLVNQTPGSRLRDCIIMKFKVGNAVEVLRRREQCDVWFPGKIISVDRYEYTVRYDLFLNHEGYSTIEEVHEKDIRPQPPHVEGGERWVLGDIAEVFDIHSWRVGKIAKVLNNRFVIRLFGSIQLKEFHRSNLRLRQVWENNKWIVIGKAGGNKPINNNLKWSSLKYSQGSGCGGPRQGIRKETHSRRRGRQEYIESFSPKTILRDHAFHFRSSPSDAIMRGVGKEKETMMKVGKKCTIGSKKDVGTERTNNYSFHPFSMLAHVNEESNECSVASCSSNDFLEYTSRNSRKSSLNIASNSFNDAKSLCALEPRRTYLSSYAEDDEFEDHVHKLELHAYKSTVQALYASGPLSWEQESLLTNLRLFLHISNEEHLLQLKHLLSAQVL